MGRRKLAEGETTEAYRQRVVPIICEEIANSDKSIWEICQSKELPDARTFARWMTEEKELCQQYARAKELQADFMAAQIRQIADECRMGKKTVFKPTGKEITTGDMVERSRLQIDARKWLASKLAPKKYGDRIDHTLANPDGTPLDLTVNFITPSNG